MLSIYPPLGGKGLKKQNYESYRQTIQREKI
jgi:hypothetical protein